MGQDRVGA